MMRSMMVTEEELVGRAQDGDLAAFESLVRAYHKRLLAFALRRVSDFDAEEVVQETLLKAFGGMRKLRHLGRFAAWLFAICRNEIVNTIRSHASGGDEDDMEDIAGLAEGETGSPGATGHEELLDAVARLGDRHKDVIRMRYFDGLSLRRIGSILGIREALVKSRLHEAREVLRRCLPGDSEATGSSFALMPLLKEAIMKSVELVKSAAFVLARLSLEDQMKVCDAVLERRRFDSGLVETISRLPSGMEFLQGSDSSLDERELAAVLNFADEGVQARLLEAAQTRYPHPTESLRRTMVLPELSPAQDKSLQLQSEVIEGCGDCLLVSLDGYIDNYNVGYFTQRFRAILTGGYNRLILDCARLNYISSTGVGAITTLRNELSRKDGDLCIVGMQAPLREVFDLLCMARFFTFCDDREEALRWARQSRAPAAPDAAREGIDLRETQRFLLQLDTDAGGTPLQTRRIEDDLVLGFGYTGLAKGMSGEYLCLHRLDDRHIGGIVSDMSGKGPEAVHGMVRAAASFQSFVDGWARSETPRSLERLAYAMNDALYRETSPGVFCAFQVVVLEGETGDCWVVHAGCDKLRLFDPDRGQLGMRQLATAPCAGSFSNPLVREKAGFRAEAFTVRPGECLVLCTDGIEESHRLMRDASLEPVSTGSGHHRREQFGFGRMAGVVAAALSRGTYELVRESCGGLTRRDVFDFSRRQGTVEDAILALAAVEELFRLTPVPVGARSEAEHAGRIAALPPQVDRMLENCLQGYSGMFSWRVRTLDDAVHYGGFLQDEQSDAVAVLGICRK